MVPRMKGLGESACSIGFLALQSRTLARPSESST